MYCAIVFWGVNFKLCNNRNKISNYSLMGLSRGQNPSRDFETQTSLDNLLSRPVAPHDVQSLPYKNVCLQSHRHHRHLVNKWKSFTRVHFLSEKKQ